MKLSVKIVFILLLMTSCSKKIFFSQEIRSNLDAQKIDLKRIQYYNSKKIVLFRELSKEELKLNSGKVSEISGKYEKIVIPKNAPAICDSLNEYKLFISFEYNKNICFTRSFEKNFKQLYGLYYQIDNDHKNYIFYDKKKYIVKSKFDQILLKIKKNSYNNNNTKTRRVRGLIFIK